MIPACDADAMHADLRASGGSDLRENAIERAGHPGQVER